MLTYWVYIVASWSRCLYIGVTNDLVRRTGEHKRRLPGPKGFTSLYHVHRLVYFEMTNDIRVAIAREKQLKRWRRERKMALIAAMNPTWRDLAANWPDIEMLGELSS